MWSDTSRSVRSSLPRGALMLQRLPDISLSTQHSAEAAVEESERIFSRLISSIEKQSREVTALLRCQERAAVTQAEELLDKIQKEVVEVRRADGELEKLSTTGDHILFLQVRPGCI